MGLLTLPVNHQLDENPADDRARPEPRPVASCPVSVSNQSNNGTRTGASSSQFASGASMASKPSRFRVRHALHTSQSA